MDFIGSLFSLGWPIRGRSGICPLGLFCGLFSIFEVRNWKFSWFRRLWFVVGGWGGGGGLWYWIWFLLYGGTLTCEYGPERAHCAYIDPLADIDRCDDVYSVKCNIVIE